jgi:flavin reductase (DIM6/NTAB) family NADH-FMN oxidoreductase RutF
MVANATQKPDKGNQGYVDVSLDRPLWERFPIVAPLVLVATTEPDGSPDVAPKHLAMPVSWENWFGFVCHPNHGTFRNIERTGVFTVGYPTPEMVLEISLAAAPREPDGSKPTLEMLTLLPAKAVDGVLIDGCRLNLECRVTRVIDDLGANALVIGEIVAARAMATAERRIDVDDADLLRRLPLLAYVHPGRVATVDVTAPFPYHLAFRR